MATDLNSLVWLNIDRRISSKQLSRKNLEQKIPRNKNTYTKWFSDARPMLSVNDLSDFARLFDISPAELLLAPGVPNNTPLQLELPFGANAAIAKLEIESTGAGLILRASP